MLCDLAIDFTHQFRCIRGRGTEWAAPDFEDPARTPPSSEKLASGDSLVCSEDGGVRARILDTSTDTAELVRETNCQIGSAMLAHFLLKGYLKFAIRGISYVNGTDRLSRITKQSRANSVASRMAVLAVLNCRRFLTHWILTATRLKICGRN